MFFLSFNLLTLGDFTPRRSIWSILLFVEYLITVLDLNTNAPDIEYRHLMELQPLGNNSVMIRCEMEYNLEIRVACLVKLVKWFVYCALLSIVYNYQVIDARRFARTKYVVCVCVPWMLQLPIYRFESQYYQ